VILVLKGSAVEDRDTTQSGEKTNKKHENRKKFIVSFFIVIAATTLACHRRTAFCKADITTAHATG
jgi:hypothetical protein